MLGNPRVNLVRPAEPGMPQITRPAPTAADIAGLGGRWHLDLPGNPLSPGCTYAKDFAALKAAGEAPPITYAHIARERGHPGLVVQYWFFYYFNQFNDIHEGDWEGMQIAFDADSGVLTLGFSSPSDVPRFKGTTPGKGTSDRLRTAIEQSTVDGQWATHLQSPLADPIGDREASARRETKKDDPPVCRC